METAMSIYVVTNAKSALDVAKWIDGHSFFEGWVSNRGQHRGLALRGNECELFIPNTIDVEGVYEPSDYDETGKMYELTEFGRSLLPRTVEASPAWDESPSP